MPYAHVLDLPESIKNILPLHAQEIYRAAFNSAWEEYEDPKKRLGTATREETAHKVAWAAVKKKYTKINYYRLKPVVWFTLAKQIQSVNAKTPIF